MNTNILICCVVIIVLLIVILIKQFKSVENDVSNEIKNAVEQMAQMRERDNRSLMDQFLIQSKATIEQIDLLGRGIRESQEQQHNSSKEAITKVEEQMSSLRRENQGSLDKINSVVTEKMQNILDERLSQVNKTVVSNIVELAKNVSDNQKKQGDATVESLGKLSEEFKNIRTEINAALINIRDSNAQSMEKLRHDNQESLDKINNTVNEKLQKTLDDKISKSFETVNQRLKEVYEGLGEMKNVASGVNDLKNVLSNVKTRGTLGEIQLGAILEEILAPEQYSTQVKLDPSNTKDERVDFAVKLPGPNDEGIWLPIDSKFPGDTYAALMTSYESGDANAVKDLSLIHI